MTSLKPKVVDGTTCYRGIRDICIGGECKEIPCDLDMESNAVEDMCGVCKGDSTSCILKEGTQFIAEQPRTFRTESRGSTTAINYRILFTIYNEISNFSLPKGLKKLLNVPSGAKNIRVEEAEPTKSRIVVKSKSSKAVLIDGYAARTHALI